MGVKRVQVRIAEQKDIDTISNVLAASCRNVVNDDYLDLLPDNHWVDFLIKGLNNGSIFAMVLEDSQRIMGGAIGSSTQFRTKI